MKLKEIAEKINAKVVGDANKEISWVGSFAHATPDQISFITSEKNLAKAKASQQARPADLPVAICNVALPLHVQFVFGQEDQAAGLDGLADPAVDPEGARPSHAFRHTSMRA